MWIEQKTGRGLQPQPRYNVMMRFSVRIRGRYFARLYVVRAGRYGICARNHDHACYSSVRSSSWDSFLALAHCTMTASKASAIPTGMAA